MASSEDSSAALKTRDWILRNLLFLDPNLPPFRYPRSTDRTSLNSSSEVNEGVLRLIECNILLGGRRSPFKVRVQPPSPEGGEPGFVSICHHVTNEEVRALNANLLRRASLKGQLSCVLLFKNEDTDEKFEVIIEFHSSVDRKAFCDALRILLGVHLQDDNIPQEPTNKRHLTNKPSIEDPNIPRALLIRGYGLADEPLRLVLAKVGTETNDAGEEDDMCGGDTESKDTLLAKELELAKRLEGDTVIRNLYPLRSVEWYCSSSLGAGNLKFDTAKPFAKNMTRIIPTGLMSGRFVQARAELDPGVRNNISIVGRMLVTKGPILPSMSVCRQLLKHLARGRTQIAIVVKLEEIQAILSILSKKDNSLTSYMKSITHATAGRVGDTLPVDEISRSTDNLREATLSMSNRRFRIRLDFADLPALKCLEFSWTEGLFSMPEPFDKTTGRMIDVVSGQHAHHIYFAFLLPHGDRWMSMTIQCMTMLERDLLWHTAYFFFLNRAPELSEFRRWQEGEPDENMSDLQHYIRDSWLNFDGVSVTSQCSVPMMWDPSRQMARDKIEHRRATEAWAESSRRPSSLRTMHTTVEPGMRERLKEQEEEAKRRQRQAPPIRQIQKTVGRPDPQSKGKFTMKERVFESQRTSQQPPTSQQSAQAQQSAEDEEEY